MKGALALSMVLLALALAPLGTAKAQGPPGVVSGLVINGTSGASGVGGAEVTLQVVRDGALIDTRTVAPNAEGQFTFQDVPDQGSVLYVLTAVYAGIPYSLELTAEVEERWNAKLKVYETTGSMDNLSVESDSLFILKATAGARTLSALEVVSVVNRGDRAFLPDLSAVGSMAFLRFPLPPGATNLEVLSELPSGQVVQVDLGVALTTPVPPGEHGIAFTYAIPYGGRELDLSRQFGLGAGVFRLLIPEELALVSGSDLQDLGTTAIGDTIYRVFGAIGIGQGGRIAVELTKLPQPSLVQRVQERLVLRSPAGTAVPVSFVAFLAALLVVTLVRKRAAGRAEALGKGESMAEERAALAQAIAALDDQFQRGELREEEYLQRRQELKAPLLRRALREEAS